MNALDGTVPMILGLVRALSLATPAPAVGGKRGVGGVGKRGVREPGGGAPEAWSSGCGQGGCICDARTQTWALAHTWALAPTWGCSRCG